MSETLQKVQVAARQLAQVIESLPAASQAVLPAHLFCQSLQRDLQRAVNSSNQHYTALLTLSPPAREELVARETLPMQWQSLRLSNGNSGNKVRCISAGMGSSLQWHQDRGPWSQKLHINYLELLAATLAVQSFLKDQVGISVLL